MIKKLFLLIVCTLLLAACSTNSAENVEYPAREKHLENIILQGVDQQNDSLIFENGNLTIKVDDILNAIKPETNPEDVKGKSKSEDAYKIVSITTKGDTYFIKAEDDFSLELKRVGKRIFSDENGKKYQTNLDLDS